ncbi:hypothetical protein ACFL21_05370 [Patescibacteria group bacterium]
MGQEEKGDKIVVLADYIPTNRRIDDVDDDFLLTSAQKQINDRVLGAIDVTTFSPSNLFNQGIDYLESSNNEQAALLFDLARKQGLIEAGFYKELADLRDIKDLERKNTKFLQLTNELITIIRFRLYEIGLEELSSSSLEFFKSLILDLGIYFKELNKAVNEDAIKRSSHVQNLRDSLRLFSMLKDDQSILKELEGLVEILSKLIFNQPET